MSGEGLTDVFDDEQHVIATRKISKPKSKPLSGFSWIPNLKSTWRNNTCFPLNHIMVSSFKTHQCFFGVFIKPPKKKKQKEKWFRCLKSYIWRVLFLSSKRQVSLAKNINQWSKYANKLDKRSGNWKTRKIYPTPGDYQATRVVFLPLRLR